MNVKPVQYYEDKLIDSAENGRFRYDLFEKMMTATYRLLNVDYVEAAQYSHPVPAKRLKKAQAKTYRSFPEDQPHREILSELDIGTGFYVKLFDNYTLATLQAKMVGCAVSYARKHNIKMIVNTHRVNGELKVTRVG